MATSVLHVTKHLCCVCLTSANRHLVPPKDAFIGLLELDRTAFVSVFLLNYGKFVSTFPAAVFPESLHYSITASRLITWLVL